MKNRIHEGHKIKRIREIMGIKQLTLAVELGVNQQSISAMELRKTINDEQMQEVAGALRVTPEVILNFSEEALQKWLTDSGNQYPVCEQTPNIHIDKIVELYERIIKEKDSQIETLQKHEQ
jgi:transcriptional regulator with XRE-family HTH domain